jgi:hypothetical protein
MSWRAETAPAVRAATIWSSLTSWASRIAESTAAVAVGVEERIVIPSVSTFAGF